MLGFLHGKPLLCVLGCWRGKLVRQQRERCCSELAGAGYIVGGPSFGLNTGCSGGSRSYRKWGLAWLGCVAPGLAK